MEFHEALMKAMGHMGLRELRPYGFVSGRDSFVSLPSFSAYNAKEVRKNMVA